MRSAQIFFGISLVFCEGMLAQPADSIPVLTVGEALNGLEKYNGSIVIVVGREGYTDEGLVGAGMRRRRGY